MRAPLSWMREYVELPHDLTGHGLAERLIAVGLEVETVDRVGQVTGPVVVGEVLSAVPEPQRNGKTIYWCQVQVAPEDVRGIVCGAANVAGGGKVVVALPGAQLPGGVTITARRTYGHLSDGMICSARELGLGEDHSGILLLDRSAPVGADAAELLRLGDEVLDVAVTPDRGYCLSLRGLAREAGIACGVSFHDPAVLPTDHVAGQPVTVGDAGYPVIVEDTDRCPVFVALTVHDVDATAPTPTWMVARLAAAGMRSVSLPVDVTNYVMLELGQPLHAYDQAALHGPITVRRARTGETLRTLDGTDRTLDPDDLLITDTSGPIGLAGVMGGAATEVTPSTRALVLESATFQPGSITRTARRHRLPSEASRRFERAVDPAVALPAAVRAAGLLVELAGAHVDPQITLVGAVPHPAPIALPAELPGRVVGRSIPVAEVVAHLEAIGAHVAGVPPTEASTQPAAAEPAATEPAAPPAPLVVTPPTWRADLRQPFDLVEEVARLAGYHTIPSVLPVAFPGRGWTPKQRARRQIGHQLAAAGYVETPTYPFVGPAELDALMLDGDDPRRRAVPLANPLSDEAPLFRTTLLPGLLAALRRNISRGQHDVALFELGVVAHPQVLPPPPAGRPPVDRRPSPQELDLLERAIPAQPWHVCAVAVGRRDPAGWWGAGRPADWADAVEAAQRVAQAVRVPVLVEPDQTPPWHPGRGARLVVGDRVIGHAGELHPRVAAAFGLPERAIAMELDLDVLGGNDAPVPAPAVSTFPVATQDVAVVVAADVPAGQVTAALVEGAGPLLESIHLFDVYTGAQVGPGRKSLAYTLRFRAPDRTLTVEETTVARDAAVAVAAQRVGAVLRGG